MENQFFGGKKSCRGGPNPPPTSIWQILLLLLCMYDSKEILFVDEEDAINNITRYLQRNILLRKLFTRQQKSAPIAVAKPVNIKNLLTKQKKNLMSRKQRFDFACTGRAAASTLKHLKQLDSKQSAQKENN